MTAPAYSSPWQSFADAYQNLVNARLHLFQERDTLVSTLREAIADGELAPALHVMQQMGISEIQQLLPELLAIASSAHGQTHTAQNLIWSLPNDWLLVHIEAEVEPLLNAADQSSDYETYWALLTIYEGINRDLTHRLAARAATNTDEDIRDAGQSFLEKLSLD